MRCSMPILCTCIVVLSHLVVKGGFTCKILNVGPNNKLLGGPKDEYKKTI